MPRSHVDHVAPWATGLPGNFLHAYLVVIDAHSAGFEESAVAAAAAAVACVVTCGVFVRRSEWWGGYER